MDVFGPLPSDDPLILRRVAMISMHTSPLATLGGKDAGGMNVYVRDLAIHISKAGVPIDIFTRKTDPERPAIQEIAPGARIINLDVGPAAPMDKNQLYELVPEFARACVLFSMTEGVKYDVVHAHYWLSGMVSGGAPLILGSANRPHVPYDGGHEKRGARR